VHRQRYDRGVKELAAFILAGGQSRRMGADKVFLRINNETLIERALRLSRAITENVWIVGEKRKFAAFSNAVIEDVYRDRGPLGAIHAALSSTESHLNLLLAVDMPLLDMSFLNFLVGSARESNATVTVPNVGGSFQPVCAVYRENFADFAEEALRHGQNKIDPLFGKVSTRIIDEGELAHAGYSADIFRNLNTPDDLERMRSVLEVSGPRY
jgi:molybdenum cofactor guanylyltransferase